MNAKMPERNKPTNEQKPVTNKKGIKQQTDTPINQLHQTNYPPVLRIKHFHHSPPIHHGYFNFRSRSVSRFYSLPVKTWTHRLNSTTTGKTEKGERRGKDKVIPTLTRIKTNQPINQPASHRTSGTNLSIE